jgi:hypothetical protein
MVFKVVSVKEKETKQTLLVLGTALAMTRALELHESGGSCIIRNTERCTSIVSF